MTDLASSSVDEELRQRVVDTICATLPRILGREMADLSADTVIEDLNLTSASSLELMLEVEDALDIQVDVEDFDRADLETVGTLATYVAGHVLADF
jgi:acyl carrier protein